VWKEEMAKPPEDPPKDFPPRRDDTGPRRERDWYGGRTGSRVSVEIQPGGRQGGFGGGRFGDRGFGEDRPPRSGPSRFGDRPPREMGGGGRPPRETGPPIDWDKWEADLEAALKARNGEG
jgi:hypothetical protein